MEQERWRRVEALYHSALERPPEYRVAFLGEACADPELRREVEALLAQPGDGILDHPVAQAVTGGWLGPYEIRRAIGAGGMGQVFEGRDSRLGRSVAIKICAAEFASRFAVEAQAISALNHPNICTLYDVGPNYLVMELVEGPTLAERIKRGSLGFEEALGIARQIADALEAAHERGIVHRDLKPANIKIRPDGRVKVLDFGLARVLEARAAAGETTETATKSGVILGTPRYMAPEQARGQAADQRADIWAFGVVVWEMVTGQAPFAGRTVPDTISEVLSKEPAWERAPAEWRKLLNKCLAKDPRQRLRNIGDALALVEESAAGRSKRRAIPWVAALVLLVALGCAAYWFLRESRTPQEALQAMPLTAYPGSELYPSFSPDGNQVTFSWNGEKQDNFDIYVKLIASGRPLRLTTDPAPDIAPEWSPDGASISFVRIASGKRKIMLIPALGGPERELAESQFTSGDPTSAKWSPDGRWLAVPVRDSAEKPIALWLVSIESGEKRQLTRPPAGNLGDNYGTFSPDGRALAFVRYAAYRSGDLYVLRLAGDLSAKGEPRRLTKDNRLVNGIAWTADGREIVFSSDRSGTQALWRVATSGSRGLRRMSIGENGSFPSISQQGNRLVYSQLISNTTIWHVNPSDQREPPTQLIASTRTEENAQYSPDGRRIVFSSNRSGNTEIWVCDADGSDPVQVVAMGFSASAQWSPDSRRIAFDSNVEGNYQIYAVSAQGGRPQRMTRSAANDARPSWSHDGKWIYFESNRAGGQSWQVWKMPAGGGEPVQITKQGGYNPLESADGRTIYYTKRETGPSPLCKVPAEGGDETQVLDAVAGRAFALAASGLYFISQARLQYHDFSTGITKPIRALEKPAGNWLLSVSPDERWLLYTQFDQRGGDLIRVDNFR